MKKLLFLLLITSFIGHSQNGLNENKSSTPVNISPLTDNDRPQYLKEDPQNTYNSQDINTLDLVEALDIAGIQIYKFRTGKFDKDYRLYILKDKYENGKLTEQDTIALMNTKYHYYSGDILMHDYMDQFKMFAKTEDNKGSLSIRTYSMRLKTNVELKKTSDMQFFMWKEYVNPSWKLNRKIPLMIFASSWYDEKYKVERFCGVAKLKDGDKDSEELLSSSPSYLLISYLVENKPE
ncbi:hypothetical protein [Sinomicrobium sp. M5D2P9]